jgi:hypothetical protein
MTPVGATHILVIHYLHGGRGSNSLVRRAGTGPQPGG